MKEAEEITKSSKVKFQNLENFLINTLNSQQLYAKMENIISNLLNHKPESIAIMFNEIKLSKSNFLSRIGLFEKRNEEKVEAKKKLAKEEYNKAIEKYNKKLSEYEVGRQKYGGDLTK